VDFDRRALEDTGLGEEETQEEPFEAVLDEGRAYPKENEDFGDEDKHNTPPRQVVRRNRRDGKHEYKNGGAAESEHSKLRGFGPAKSYCARRQTKATHKSA